MAPTSVPGVMKKPQIAVAKKRKPNALTVAEDESLDDVEGHEGDFPIYLDQDESVYEAYGLEHIPTVFILNDQGEVLGSAQGEEDSLTLLQEYASYNQ